MFDRISDQGEKMNSTLKNILNNFLRIGLTVGILWYLSTKIDFKRTLEIVKTADLSYVFYAFLLFLFVNVVMITRWFIFIKALDLKVSFWVAVRFYVFGMFGNLFLPTAIGGDVVKIIGLCQTSDEKPKVVASVLLDRISGFAGMVVVASSSLVFGFKLMHDFSVVLFILIMAVVSVGFGFLLFNTSVFSFCTQIFSRFPRVKKALMQMHHDIALVKDRRGAIYQAIGLSVVMQILAAVTLFIVSKALHQNVSLFYFIIFMPLLCVVATIPSLGGLGPRELGSKYFYGLAGVDAGIAVSISLINYLFLVIVGVIGGIFFYFNRSKKSPTSVSIEAACFPPQPKTRPS